MKSIKSVSYTMVVGTLLMHVFCCGIPFVMSLVSLAASLGLSGVGAFDIPWIHQYETAILWVSGSMLAMTGLLQWIAERRNCVSDGGCHHEPCDSKKLTARQIYYIAVGIYLANLLLIQLTHHH